MFKVLAGAMWSLGAFALLVAVIAHVVNNAKGIGKTVWMHKVNAICAALFLLCAGAGAYLWDL